jgi:hypothetical protein
MRVLIAWLILAAAAALRIALLSPATKSESRAFTPDSHQYASLAAHLGEGRFEALRTYHDPSRIEMFTEPEIFRTPGYPLFLRAAARVAPSKAAAPPPRPSTVAKLTAFPQWRAALTVQVALDVLLVLMTYLLGRELAGGTVGLVAAALQAISPLAVAASCRLLSDSVFAFLLTASLWAMARHLRTGGWLTLLLSAALLAAGCYVRPVGLVVAGIFALVLLVRPKRFRRLGVFAVVLLASIVPWVVRNARVADYVGFSSFATDSLYHYSAAGLVARNEGITLEQARRKLRAEMSRHDVGRTPTPGDRARYRCRRAGTLVAADPRGALVLHLRGCPAFWLPGATDVLELAGRTRGQRGTLEVLHRQGPAAAARHYFGGDTVAMALAGAMAAVLAVRYLGVLICLLRKFRPRMPAAAWLGGILVVVCFLLPGPAAHPRFRVPVAPLLSVAAAAGWAGLIAAIRRRRKGEEARQVTVRRIPHAGPEPGTAPPWTRPPQR